MPFRKDPSKSLPRGLISLIWSFVLYAVVPGILVSIFSTILPDVTVSPSPGPLLPVVGLALAGIAFFSGYYSPGTRRSELVKIGGSVLFVFYLYYLFGGTSGGFGIITLQLSSAIIRIDLAPILYAALALIGLKALVRLLQLPRVGRRIPPPPQEVKQPPPKEPEQGAPKTPSDVDAPEKSPVTQPHESIEAGT